jgi:hypothetical protein
VFLEFFDFSHPFLLDLSRKICGNRKLGHLKRLKLLNEFVWSYENSELFESFAGFWVFAKFVHLTSEKYWLKVGIRKMQGLPVLLEIVSFCKQVALHKYVSVARKRWLAIILIVIEYIVHLMQFFLIFFELSQKELVRWRPQQVLISSRLALFIENPL